MEITRNNCEQYLRYVLAKIVKANVRSATALLAVPALNKGLMKGLYHWCSFIACRQTICLEIGQEIGLDVPDLVSDMVNHVFRKSKGAYPTLTKILDVAHADGPDAVVPYMMRAVRFRVIDLKRRYEVRAERMGEIRGYTQDDEYGVIDPGDSRDNSGTTPEEDLVRREGMSAFLATMGKDPKHFASDVCILADAVGIKRALVCQLFFSGRQSDLVAMVISRLGAWLHRDVSGALSGLKEQAREYVLPARFKADQEALLAYLYRQTGSGARGKMAERRHACGM